MSDELDNLEEQILAWIDGDLDAAAAAELERTLAGSPRYQHLLRDFEQQRQALAAMPAAPVPLELSARLRTQVEAAHPKNERLGRRYRLAASILLMVGIGVVAYRMLPQPAGTAPLTQRPASHEYLALEQAPVPLGDEAADTLAIRGAAGRQSALGMEVAEPTMRTVIHLGSADLPAAQKQIASVLASNGIAFSQAQPEISGSAGFNSLASAGQAKDGRLYSSKFEVAAGVPAEGRVALPAGERVAGEKASAVRGKVAAKEQDRSGLASKVNAAAPPPAASPAPAAAPPAYADARKVANQPEQAATPSPTAPARVPGTVGPVAAAKPAQQERLADQATKAFDAPSRNLVAADTPGAAKPDAFTPAQQAEPLTPPAGGGTLARDTYGVAQQALAASSGPRSQQVFVARNLRSDEVAQVEKALEDAAPQKSRVLSISNSQRANLDLKEKLSEPENRLRRDAEEKGWRASRATTTAPAAGIDLLIVLDADAPVVTEAAKAVDATRPAK